MQTDIIDYQPGLHIAVRQGYQSRYGVITATTTTQVTVRLEDGSTTKFSRRTRFMVGHPGTRYDCPYLTSVATARAKDAEYQAACDRVRASRTQT